MNVMELKAADEVMYFPLRVASIDVGSNALRFLAAEFKNQGEFDLLLNDRYPLRLGHDVFLSGKMTAETISSAVEGLKTFSDNMRRLDIQKYRAVATSAVRESRNGEELIEKVRNDVGLDLETISGSEEARLIHLSVKRHVPLGDEQWVLTDLGGGSVEVSLVDDAGILWSESHTMGSVRLLEKLAGSGEEPEMFKKLLEEYIATLRIPTVIQNKKPAGFIATGGNIETIASLLDPQIWAKTSRVPLTDLKKLIEKLARLPYRERIRELNLKEDRADVILPAALVYERLCKLVGADEIIVPHAELREGIVLDLVNGIWYHENLWDKQTLEGAVSLGRKYMFDEAHALQVARLSLLLFDQLKGIHKLGVKDRQILFAAGILHDIGSFISFKKHHKHALYILSQSDLPGFSQREMQMIANTSRYHRKSEPSMQHVAFSCLRPDEQERVSKLSALLRIADAMDREHLQKITDLRTEVDNGKLTITIKGKSDLLLERWAFQKKSQYFSDLFNLELYLKIKR
jgi:exopolyphosphatase/guanosine-5'-triphosphate,3'-diphosphate pyrophosphatase